MRRAFFLFFVAIVSLSARTRDTKLSTLLKETKNTSDKAVKKTHDSEVYVRYATLFDEQMNSVIASSSGRWALSNSDQDFYQIFRDLYARNADLLEMPVCSIPKKIHQIWIGSEPPQELLELSERIREIHPDFEYKLWRDSDLAEFNLNNFPPFFAAPNWGEKADIFRYFILNKYGGVYFDMDIVCVKSIEPLLRGAHCVIGLANTRTIECNNAVIAATPNNPVIKAFIARLTFPTDSRWKKLHTITRTGPQYVTRVICDLAKQPAGRGLLVLPIPYFYPVPNSYHGPQSAEVLSKYVTPESFCVHLWECRWIKPGGMRNGKS